MRTLGWFARRLGNYRFMSHYWTALGNKIYYPERLTAPPEHYIVTIAHEKVHIRQMQKLTTPVFLFLYLCCPLPIGLAWFRWRMEREAYLVNIAAAPNRLRTIECIVKKLGSAEYGWCWPKPWMRRWFLRQLVSGRLADRL